MLYHWRGCPATRPPSFRLEWRGRLTISIHSTSCARIRTPVRLVIITARTSPTSANYPRSSRLSATRRRRVVAAQTRHRDTQDGAVPPRAATRSSNAKPSRRRSSGGGDRALEINTSTDCSGFLPISSRACMELFPPNALLRRQTYTAPATLAHLVGEPPLKRSPGYLLERRHCLRPRR